jgi:GMP synthase (glutamine-hydrolysing)
MRRPVLVIEHEATAGASLMEGALGSAVEVVRPYLGAALPESSQLAGLIVLGGSMGAWDDEIAPWLPATRSLIRDAVRTQLPVLGICLGGQLLAAACGGTVERGADGLELGLVPVVPLPEVEADPFFGAVQRALTADEAEDEGSAGDRTTDQAARPWLVHQYHYDAVTRLPVEAELLITAGRYPHQGFRVGPAAWGVQYHPEVSTGLFTEWVEGAVRSGELPAESVGVLGPVRDAGAAQMRLAALHAGAFLDVVSDAGAVRGLR